VWPTAKYRLIAAQLVTGGHIHWAGFTEPRTATWDDLALVHTPEYLDEVRNGLLTEEDIRTLELPWMPELVDGFRLMTGGTCMAAELALESGTAVHLGGGLHHGFPDHGEGFCLFNDVAVAVRVLQRDSRLRQAAIVDCDVHHGNGTAFIFAADPAVFTFSIHQQRNYPDWKPASDLDIGLPDETTDEEYLTRLAEALPNMIRSRPQLIVYLAGADPFEGDRLGGLALTLEGLRRRDRLVLDVARAAGIPVVVVLAGGYALLVEDTVQAHVNTVVEVLKS
jgi:acetoin utilization deacetylase AcuC-like enzyme